MIDRMRLWWAMAWFEAQRFRAYPLEMFAAAGAVVAEVVLYTTFWLVVAQFSGSPIDLTALIRYYLIISGLAPFFYCGFSIGSLITELVKTGKLSQTLVLPINPIWYPWALRTGRNSVSLVFGLAQIIIGITMGGGVRPELLPMLPIVLFNTLAINMAFNIMIGASSFYTTEARNLKNACLHLASFLRGERMPIYLMTPELANLLMLTPFPASLYHLTMLLQGSHPPTWPQVLIGAGWSVALLFISLKVWRVSLKRYEAVGL